MQSHSHAARGQFEGRHAVIILNYKGRQDTISCLETLMQNSDAIEIYLVDNGSDDGVIAEVNARWPSVETIALPENLGFSGGMNVGIRRALQKGASVVTVLNNDTLIPVGTLPALAIHANRGAVAVSPMVYYSSSEGRVWFGGGVLDEQLGIPRHLTDEEMESQVSPESIRPTGILAGCCLTASAAVWRKVGLFDERYFLMFEDSDWSLRARSKGVDLFVATDINIRHSVSASFKGPYSYLGLYYYVRNGILFGSTWASSPRMYVLRFLRHRILPELARPLRKGQLKQAIRQALIVAFGTVDYATGRYGRAGDRLEKHVMTWVRATAI